MPVRTPLAMTIVLLLAAVGCANGGDGGGSDEGDVTDTEATASDGQTSTTPDEVDLTACLDTTTTTADPTTSTSLDVCEVVEEQMTPDQVADVSELWSGTVTGEVTAPSCTTASQSGVMVLLVSTDGGVNGRGYTQSGAYTCDNGASIPEMYNEYGITGTKHERFALTFSSGGAQLTSSLVEGGRAELVQDTGFGVVTTELVCDDGC